MTPYRNPGNAKQMAYNYLLKKERVIIENAFGQLKMRFQILKYGIWLKGNNIIPKTNAPCFILHNIAKSMNEPDIEVIDPEDDKVVLPNVNNNKSAQQSRDRIACLILNI